MRSNYMSNYMNSQRHTLLAENYMLKEKGF